MKYKIALWICCTFLCISSSQAQLKYVDNDSISFIKMMFVGDVSPNSKLIESTYNEITNSYDFQSVFHYIRPILNLGDIVACNLESTIGTTPYGVYPTYKSPEELVVSLKYAGFNMVMTANEKTINQTEDEWNTQKTVLDKANIDVAGSYISKDDEYDRNPTIFKKDGIDVAVLNYMAGTSYDTSNAPIVNIAQKDKIQDDVFMAKNRGADFIIIYFHWGKEFQKDANEEQKELANYCIEAGANMIMGTHPHTVQQMFFRNYYTNGQYAEGVVAYSLGDFLSTANTAEVNSSCILELILAKDLKTGMTRIHDYGYIPTYTHQYEDDGIIKWAIMPVSQIERDHMVVPMNETSQKAMKASIDKIRYKMSGYMDEVEYELDNEIVEDVAEVVAVQGRPLNETKDFKMMDQNMMLTYNELTRAKYGLTSNSTGVPSDFESGGDDWDFDAPDLDKIVYRVQFMETSAEAEVDLKSYRHLEGYEMKLEEGVYRYYYGRESVLYKINDLCLDIKRLGHKNAFVVAYKNGKRIPMK